MTPWHQQGHSSLEEVSNERPEPKFSYGEAVMARGHSLDVPVVIDGLFYSNKLGCWEYSVSFPEFPSAKPLELIESGLFRSKAQMRKRMRVVS